MKRTLIVLAVIASGALALGASTAASAYGWHHHRHHGFFGGIIVVPYMGGGCYSNCRAYHGPRYCHARCGY
jgi:hypothetical protein